MSELAVQSALTPQELDEFTSRLVIALKTVYDPEIPADIYELGLIYKIDIEDDGTIKVAAVDGKAGEAAINWIRGIVAEPEVGVIYDGKVVKVMEFGAFVNFFGARDGLVHISQLAPRKVAKTQDVVKEGDKVKVKFLGFDDRGKTKLSMKIVDQETGEDLEAKQKAEREAQKAAEAE